MTADNQQIVTAFEDCGLTPEAIAEEFQFDLSAVKAVLMQHSVKFRGDAQDNPGLDFTDTEAIEVRDMMMQIARYTEDEHLKFKALKYIRDDKKGRLDLGKQLKGLNINVLAFNEQMQKAIQAKHRSKGKPITDISATIVPDNTPVQKPTSNTHNNAEVLEAIVAD